MTNEERKIMCGQLYTPGDPELVAMKLRAHSLSQDYNKLYEDQTDERNKILRDLFLEFGEGSFMQGPIFIHYGVHTRIGAGCFFNFNTTIQDDCMVTIGDNCNFGPGLTIATPVHPLVARERNIKIETPAGRKGVCSAKPVTIEDGCWFGANVVVCPGVTVGDNCVIGAGSVVTSDIPDNSFAAGNPCRVIRPITQEDSMIHKPEILADNSVI